MTDKKAKAPRKGSSVYNVMQAEQFNGKFNKNMSRKIDTKTYPNAYADTVNANFKRTGKYLELNTAADAKRQAAIKARTAVKPAKKATKKVDAPTEKVDAKPLFTTSDLKDKTLKELRKLAQGKIKAYSSMNTATVTAALLALSE